MTQLGLLPDVEPKGRKHHVQRTSVLAYQELKSKDRRVSEAVLALQRYARVHGDDPTSAELTRFDYQCWPTTDMLLTIRIGLSDAKRLGLVENAGKRQCSVSGRLALTWKVRTR